MNKIITKYLLINFFKSIFLWISIFYCFGIILTLFEELEFFKNLDVSFITPLVLTSIYVPSEIIKLLPFIIFIASMWYMVRIRNSKDLLTMKVFGYSNLKIFSILATTSFIIGWIILVFINPLTSSMSRYYEKTKSNYARDIDHLVTFNKNGLWIKENIVDGTRIITANRIEGHHLVDVTIFQLNNDFKLKRKIFSKKANILDNNWILNDVEISDQKENFFDNKKFEIYNIDSIYNLQKITTLFKNYDTMSFLDLINNYNYLLENGYNKKILNESLNSLLSFPFFLFMMTAIASILTMNTLKRSDNLKFIIIGIIVCAIVFYLKNLSLSLGHTDRIPIILSVWSPVIALSFFSFIGVLQINEK